VSSSKEVLSSNEEMATMLCQGNARSEAEENVRSVFKVV